MAHYRFLFITCLFLPMQSFALSQEQQYNDNLNWAKQSQQGIIGKAQGKLDINDYCGDADCVNQALNPPQAGLDDTSMNDQKTTAFFSNDSANALQNNFDKGRPDIKNDPNYQFALLGQENAFEISHGLSNDYVDCQGGTQCLIKHIPRTCNSPTNNEVPCHKIPIASVLTSEVLYTCPTGWSQDGRMCKRVETECRYDASNFIKEQVSNSSNCSQSGLGWFWNGKRVWGASYSKGNRKGGGSMGTCQGSQSWSLHEICGPVEKVIPATLTCEEGFTLSGENCVKNEFTWKTECSLINACQVTSEICIEGRETRIVNGVPTTLECWKYQVNHLCETPDSCISLPSDCQTTSKTCSLMQNGVCVEEERQKSCPQKDCSSTNLICGETSFCLDGDCYDATPTTSDDFDQAAAGLAGLAEAAKNLGDPPLIFTGKGMKCTDKAFGFADCCKDGGWGTDIGISECSAEEKALGRAKEQGLTISLGSYCASSFLGACTRKKKTYCVYDSKLSRIIQQQGATGQLGLALGSTKEPICGSLTPEQLQQINFEHIDFSDFYEDMHADTQLPSASEIQERLASALAQ